MVTNKGNECNGFGDITLKLYCDINFEIEILYKQLLPFYMPPEDNIFQPINIIWIFLIKGYIRNFPAILHRNKRMP